MTDRIHVDSLKIHAHIMSQLIAFDEFQYGRVFSGNGQNPSNSMWLIKNFTQIRQCYSGNDLLS